MPSAAAGNWRGLCRAVSRGAQSSRQKVQGLGFMILGFQGLGFRVLGF